MEIYSFFFERADIEIVSIFKNRPVKICLIPRNIKHEIIRTEAKG